MNKKAKERKKTQRKIKVLKKYLLKMKKKY